MPDDPAEGKMRFIQALLCDRHGATAIEYGLIVALIVLAILGALGDVAGKTVTMWNEVANAFTSH